MKKGMRILTIALALLMAMGNLRASAADYAPITGGKTSFNKYFLMDRDANVPGVEFTFTIAPGAGKPATDTTMEVLPGVGNPTIGSAAFTTADTTYTSVQTGDQITLASGQKYAKKAVEIDFSGVSFDEPGIYRYKIEEQYGYHPSIFADVNKNGLRYLDVYVIDDPENPGTLKIAAYVLHEKDNVVELTVDNGSNHDQILADKSDGFINEYVCYPLILTKTVQGNQGSKDKYFKFTVKIEAGIPGQILTVDLSNADAKSGSNSATKPENRDQDNPTEIVLDDTGKATVYFYMKHSQSITIKGLGEKTLYSVEEDEEDYKKTITDTMNNGGIDLVDGIDREIQVDFVNTRNGVIPTGILVSVVPGVALVGLAAVGYFFIRKKDEDEE